MKLNTNWLQLPENYLFSEIARRIQDFTRQNPDKELLKLSIGDVTRPLARVITEEMKRAAEDMAHAETFHGYGPEQGELFLREAVSEYYARRGVEIEPDDIFIGDGAKNDLGNLCDLFSDDNLALLPNPVYPVYFDTSVISGRRVAFLSGTKENGFLPMPDPRMSADIIYLCSPNNPTGAVYTKEQLKAWVEYALRNGAVILFDAAYESYIHDETLPRTIYEIEGAKACAIEVNSLSKMAGFTGVRCGWTICPKTLSVGEFPIHNAWKRRAATKYNGTSYIIQRAAAAVFTEEGQRAVHEDIAYYMDNAKILKDALQKSGVFSTGGENAPYVWMECPENKGSWELFDTLLNRFGIAGTPGAGFGGSGEGWLRFSSFGSRETVLKAAKILETLDWEAL